MKNIFIFTFLLSLAACVKVDENYHFCSSKLKKPTVATDSYNVHTGDSLNISPGGANSSSFVYVLTSPMGVQYTSDGNNQLVAPIYSTQQSGVWTLLTQQTDSCKSESINLNVSVQNSTPSCTINAGQFLLGSHTYNETYGSVINNYNYYEYQFEFGTESLYVGFKSRPVNGMVYFVAAYPSSYQSLNSYECAVTYGSSYPGASGYVYATYGSNNKLKLNFCNISLGYNYSGIYTCSGNLYEY